MDRCQEAAANSGCKAVPLDFARIPFTIHLNEEADVEAALADVPTTAEDLHLESAESTEAEASPEALAEAQQAAEQQAQVVRELKDSGRTNTDPDVQAEVKRLLELKVRPDCTATKACLISTLFRDITSDHTSWLQLSCPVQILVSFRVAWLCFQRTVPTQQK